MRIDWSPLRTELAEWRGTGTALSIWWRDDDAIAPTPALDQLCHLSRDLGVPVHLAVIPASVQTSMSPFLTAHPELVPVVHGWAHENHSLAGQKSAEFGHPRAQAVSELDAGLERLRGLFGSRLTPMFVPPWNRIDDAYFTDLAGLGYRAVSAFTPRKTRFAAPGVLRINTHIDPIDWRGTRGLSDPDALVAKVASAVQDRRTGRADNTEPLGLLTHHLVHDEDVWTFTQALISELLHAGAVPADIDQIISEDP